MVRRILAIGLGGVSGAVFWMLFRFAPTGRSLYALGLCVVGGGWLFSIIGEKTGLIPTQEALDERTKPQGLFDKR